MTERPDIAVVLDHYGVTDRRRMVSCLLHDDRTPSCSVDYNQSLWRCHSCSQGGTSWDLIMAKEGLDFRAAVEWAESTLGFSDGGDGASGGFISGSRFAARRTVPTGKGPRREGSKYVPTWRR